MIQLPSKIRTTLFNASVEVEPYQLFTHEDDRLFVIIYSPAQFSSFPAFGRSSQDIKNSDYITSYQYSPLYFYGPEPLFMGLIKGASPSVSGFVIVHGIYRA